MLPASRYYQGRQSPVRKSIAYSPPRRDGFPFTEVPGQSSNDFNLFNNNDKFQQHANKTQAQQSFAMLDPSKAGYHSQKDLLLKKFRQSLNTRGMRGFVGLKRQFKLIDTDGNGYLSLNEFLQAFDDLKITNIQSSDLKMVFGIYDLKKECRINYTAFINDLYEELPLVRQQLVVQAFKHLDANKSGDLSLEEVKAKFEPSRHPDVLKGIKTVEEARFEFFNLFTSLHSANKGFKNETTVTFADFAEWHAIVNTQIERDADFRNFIVSVWSLDLKENCEPTAGGIENVEIARQTDRNARQMYKHDFHRKTFGNEQILAHPLPAQVEEMEMEPKIITNPNLRKRAEEPPKKLNPETHIEIAQRIAAKVRSRGARGIQGLGRSFTVMDRDRSGTLSLQEVAFAMRDYHITDDKEEVNAIFEIFDIDHSGSISYDEFLRVVVGEMNDRRRHLCELAFRKLDHGNDGIIDLADIKRTYNGKKHPNVLQGK